MEESRKQIEEAQAKLDLWTRKVVKTTAPQLAQASAEEEVSAENEHDAPTDDEGNTLLVEDALDEKDVVVPKAKGKPRKAK